MRQRPFEWSQRYNTASTKRLVCAKMTRGDKDTHDGLLVASRASLSLRFAWPVEESLRCFSALCTFAVALCPPWGKLLGPLKLLGVKEEGVNSWVTGIGEALAAAMDSESRVDTAEFSL